MDDDALDEKQRAELLRKLNQKSTSNRSETTSMLQMRDKLKEVISPSSSKPDEEDEYYQEHEDDRLYQAGEDSCSDITGTSIPIAHREYEKILR